MQTDYSSCAKFVIGFDNAEFPVISEVFENLALGKESLSSSVHVIPNGKINEFVALLGSRRTRWQHWLDDRIEVGRRHFLAGTCRLHGTAALVPQHYDDRAPKVLDGVFQTPDTEGIGAIPSRAHDEQIS